MYCLTYEGGVEDGAVIIYYERATMTAPTTRRSNRYHARVVIP